MSSALVGSTGILEAIKENAPAVKRVVITSKFKAIVDPNKKAGEKYTEVNWLAFDMDSS